MTKLGSQKLHICPEVTNRGSTIGHRIDYNGVGALSGQRHIRSKNLPKYLPGERRGFVEIITVFLESSTGSQSILISEFSFQPKSKWLVKRIVPLFFTPKVFYKKIHKRTRILLVYLKNMKYSAALPMFLIWRENLLSYDNMRFFFLTLRRSKGCDFSWKNIHKILLDSFRK